MKTNNFFYDGKERNILVVEETENDIFGYDLDLWPEESKQLLKTSFRHFKKDKMKTNGNAKNPEERPKREA